MAVKAKFKCVSKKETAYSTEIEFEAVCADEIPENQRYHKWTPSGNVKIAVTNPDAIASFLVNKKYYLDFTPVDAANEKPSV
ncbi:hypothetical protein IT570_03530 [Candidatus Sumerlaeota bacterium]|nr:hypothetical protein [Candidatus Sumerlaeota bacterium]